MRALSAGLVHRPPPGELEQKGILKSSGEVKEKKLTLNMLFQKKNAKGAPSGGAAAPINVTLSEPDLDALVLQMADEQRLWGARLCLHSAHALPSAGLVGPRARSC